MKFGIVHSQNMSLPDWSVAFVYAMSDTVVLPQLETESDFVRWAAQIVQEPILEAFHLPGPTSFLKWQEWAEQVNSALASAGAF